MGSFSIWHWMLFLAVALLLFGGKGKISDIMGDVAKGVKSFKKGMSDDETHGGEVRRSVAQPRESRCEPDRRQRQAKSRLNRPSGFSLETPI